MEGTSNKYRLAYALGGLTVIAYVWHCLALHYVVDDAFITFRYVKNFVSGNGLVFNLGERVEGYTNFLWAMLLSAFLYLKPDIDLLIVAQTLGVLLGVATIVLVMRFALLVGRPWGPFGVIAGALLALNASYCAWSTGGLETNLFTFLIFAGCYAYLYSLQTESRRFLAPVLFALAAMTRPEGMLIFGVISLHLLVTEWRSGRGLVNRRTAGWFAAFAAIFAPYYAWRFAYYGYPLPNTFYAKVGSGRQQYLRGVRYLGEYVKTYGAFVLLFPLPLVLKKQRERWVNVFLMVLGAYVAYIIYVGGDGLAYHRFVVPAMPFFYLLAQEGLREAYAWAKAHLRAGREWTPAAAACVLAIVALGMTGRQSLGLLLFPSSQRWYEPQSGLSFPGTGEDHGYIMFDNYFVERQALAARWLEANARPGAVVASTPAGSIAYNMNLNVIDMLGLNDVHIAHTPGNAMGKDRAGHEKGDGKYVLSRSPDYILLGNVAVLPKPLSEEEMAQKLVRKSEHEIWADPDFHNRYELVSVKLSDEGVFRYFTFYKKKSLELSQGAPPQPEQATPQPAPR